MPDRSFTAQIVIEGKNLAGKAFGSVVRGLNSIKKAAESTRRKIGPAFDRISESISNSVSSSIPKSKEAFRQLSNLSSESARQISSSFKVAGRSLLNIKTSGQAVIAPLSRVKKQAAEVSSAFKKIGPSVSRSISTSGRAIEGTLSKVKTRTVAIVASITAALAGIAGGNIFGAAIGASANFEEAMDRAAAKTIDLSDAMRDRLTEEAERLGATTRFTATEAANGFEILAQAGFSAIQQIEALPAVLDTAIAANVGLAESSQIVADALTVFGKEADQAGNVADVLAKGSLIANTSITKLARTVNEAGQISDRAGLGLEGVAAAALVLANNGIRGERSATALRSILARLANDTGPTREALRELGIDTSDFTEVIDQLGNLSAPNLTKALLSFDQEALPAISALVKGGVSGFKEFEAQLESAEGTSKRVAKEVADNLRGSFKTFQSAIESVFIALADQGVLDALSKSIDGISNKFREFAASDSIKKISDSIVVLINSFSNGAKVIASFSGSIGLLLQVALVAKIAKWTKALAGFLGAFGAAGAVVAKTGAAITGFGRILSAIAAIATRVGSAFKSFLPVALAVEAIKLAGNLLSLSDANARVAETAKDAAENNALFADRLATAQDELKQYADTVILTEQQIEQLTSEELKSYRDRLKAAQDYFVTLRLEARALGDSEGVKRATAQYDKYGKAIEDASGEIAQLVTNAEAAAKVQAEAIESLSNSFSELGTSLNAVQTGVSDTERNIIGAVENIASSTEATSGLIASAFEDAFEQVKSPQGLIELSDLLNKVSNDATILAGETEALQQAESDFTEALIRQTGGVKNLNDAQLENIQTIRGLFDEVSKVREEIVRLETAQRNARKEITRLEEAQKKGADVSEEIARARELEASVIEKIAAARIAEAASIDTATKAVEESRKSIEAEIQDKQRQRQLTIASIDTRIAEQQAIQASANAHQDETASRQAAINILQLEAEKSREVANAKREEATAALATIEAIKKQIEAGEIEAEQGEKQIAQQKAIAETREQEARSSEANARSKLAEVEATKRVTTAVEAEISARERQTNQATRAIDVKLAETRATEAQAKASGDEAAQRKAQSEIAQLEIEQLKALAEGKRAEADAVKKLVKELEIQAAIDGKITDKEKEAIAQAKENLKTKQAEADIAEANVDAKEAEIEATEELSEASEKAADEQKRAAKTAADLAAATDFLTSVLNAQRKKLGEVSEASVKAFNDHLVNGAISAAEAIDTTNEKLADANERLLEATRLDKFGGVFSSIIGFYQRIAGQIEVTALKQQSAVERLIQGVQSGSRAAEAELRIIGTDIESLRHRFDLLDDQDLNNLINSIQNVNKEIDQSADKVGQLRERLAQLRGDEIEAQELRNKRAVLELEQELQEAQARGNAEEIRNLEEALKLQKQINKEELQQLKQRDNESRKDRERERETGSRNNQNEDRRPRKPREPNNPLQPRQPELLPTVTQPPQLTPIDFTQPVMDLGNEIGGKLDRFVDRLDQRDREQRSRSGGFSGNQPIIVPIREQDVKKAAFSGDFFTRFVEPEVQRRNRLRA